MEEEEERDEMAVEIGGVWNLCEKEEWTDVHRNGRCRGADSNTGSQYKMQDSPSFGKKSQFDRMSDANGSENVYVQ